MILADKIIYIRKKAGLSQEELAEKMGVSRQAVSKWESAQSVPDIGKILQLSRIFDVSTDYLLKDEIEEKNSREYPAPEKKGNLTESSMRRVSKEEAVRFLEVKEETSKKIADAVFLCILSPVCLIILGGLSEYGRHMKVSENFAGAVGIIVLMALVAVAVAMFISSGGRTRAYTYIGEETFETEYGVEEMARTLQREFEGTYTQGNIKGAVICILAAVPVVASSFFADKFELLAVVMVVVTMITAGIGVRKFIKVGIIWASFEKLLQEGEYTRAKKKGSLSGIISSIYWIVTTAVFLCYSFVTDNWEKSWIIWPVAGVLYGAVAVVCKMIENKEKN